MFILIEGKVYNTEASDMLGTYTNGLPPHDENYKKEVLYRTKRGTYFLHIATGSKIMPAVLDMWSEYIIPLSYKGALEWANNSLTEDEIESNLTGVVLTISAKVSPELRYEFEKYKEDRDFTTEEAIADLLE